MQDHPNIITTTPEAEKLTETQEHQAQAMPSRPVDQKKASRKSVKEALTGLKAIARMPTKKSSAAKAGPKDEPVKKDQYEKAEAFASLKKDMDELEAMLPRMRQAISILALDDVVKPNDATTSSPP